MQKSQPLVAESQRSAASGDVASVGILSMSSVAPLNLLLKNAGSDVVNGNYIAKNSKTIPVGFAKTCEEMSWNSQEMWLKLSNQVSPWWKHKDNESYIYYNQNDGQWWIDDPSGKGLYVAKVPTGVINAGNMNAAKPPVVGWTLLSGAIEPAPLVQTVGY
mmetsp:Transcript_97/g.111  ORF Transcript_97/g.111 Transcript_97/m.111 type:complete len:160 (+) Transcript_97:98-577(+)|eukprot:CAMPEP_0119037656 /NCGR_PEP_ID=MMETSP1177-20130426/6148_1 /TAXON_ID=2985 /ORGANISM="Ochromonas sp, Strain CCMP1899" /LENGTH=159 /DNA_ID=CAMNT_0006999237 /DNA_START=78 /DNA_END=557 /DNA_ORIENTATION=-